MRLGAVPGGVDIDAAGDECLGAIGAKKVNAFIAADPVLKLGEALVEPGGVHRRLGAALARALNT